MLNLNMNKCKQNTQNSFQITNQSKHNKPSQEIKQQVYKKIKNSRLKLNRSRLLIYTRGFSRRSSSKRRRQVGIPHSNFETILNLY